MYDLYRAFIILGLFYCLQVLAYFSSAVFFRFCDLPVYKIIRSILVCLDNTLYHCGDLRRRGCCTVAWVYKSADRSACFFWGKCGLSGFWRMASDFTHCMVKTYGCTMERVDIGKCSAGALMLAYFVEGMMCGFSIQSLCRTRESAYGCVHKLRGTSPAPVRCVEMPA